MKNYFQNKTIFLTGGTGSFGKVFAHTILKKYKPKKLIIFSRDELKQYEFKKKVGHYKNVRFFIGDIRELDKEGRIQNSAHIPRGMLEFWMDPQSAYFKNGKINMEKEIVLFCAGGLRSALATKSLKDMGYKNVSHIEGGFSSMKNKGFDVE